MAKKKTTKKRFRTTKTPVKTGRPSKYHPVLATAIVNLAKQGKTVKEIAQTLGIAESTIYLWQAQGGKLSESIKEAKRQVDDMVEASLLQRALGYSAPETKYFAHEGVVVDEKETIKHYPPDATSAIFWLKNRRPEEWRDKVEIEKKQVSLSVTLTPQEARKLINQDEFNGHRQRASETSDDIQEVEAEVVTP